MKRPNVVFAAALFVCSLTAVHAQLGASKKQLTSRFGSITSTTKEDPTIETITFETPGRLVAATLTNGKCSSLTTSSIVEGFSKSDIQHILNANAQGKQWKQSQEDTDFWQRSDGAVAYINPRSVDIVASAAEGYAPPESSTLKKELQSTEPPPIKLPLKP
jgi:hypothetical protein